MNRSAKALQLFDGPRIIGHRLQHNDTLHLCVVDGIIVPLTPTEYRLILPLLRQLEKLQSYPHSEHVEVFVSFEQLQHTASLGSRILLAKHICNASAKLWLAGMAVARVDGYGYTIVFDAKGDAERYIAQSLRGQSSIRQRETQSSAAPR